MTWLQRDEAVLASVLPRVHDVVAERGEGSWLVDVDGRRWLDLTSGIGVTATGHCHPDVVAAIEAQARTLLHDLARVPQRRWLCGCGEMVEGGFEQCWRCGALMPT
jgi:4-aminobutyrate aminotransferase